MRMISGILGALLIAMVVAPAGPAAADDDLFTVRAVAVDATADTARLARDRAIAEGRRAAFQRLVERLVPASRARAVAAPTDAELERMVIGFEVADERTSSVRWLADLTVAFDPAAVRARLRSAGVPFAETRSLPVLVIPLYDTGGETVLWREPNPWRNAWYELPPQGGLVPFVVPYGDVSDIRDLSPEQAVAGDVAALARIAERYGARDAVVARARPRAGAAVELSVQRLGPSGTDRTLVETVTVGDELDPALRLLPAVERAVAMVANAWIEDNLIRPGVETRITATVPIDSLQRWLAVREALDRLSLVTRYQVVQLARREALVDIWVNGDAEQFRVAVAQRDLELLPGAGDYVLKQRGQPMPELRAAPAPDYGASGTVVIGAEPALPASPTVPASPAFPAPPAPAGPIIQ